MFEGKVVPKYHREIKNCELFDKDAQRQRSTNISIFW